MTRFARTLCLSVIVLACFPAVAYADAGTPLMWASAFHLLLGNAVIGIAEGLLLVLLFRPTKRGCVPIMVAANYFSAWVGGVILAHLIADKLALDLYNARRWLWCLVVVTYFLTLLLEWPFVALCLRKTDGWLRKSIVGSVVVQSASYLVLFGWYWMASGTSLYTDLTVVRLSDLSLPKDAMVYYIAESGENVYECDPSKGKTTKVCELKSSEKEGRLLLRESSTGAGHWDLIVGSESEDRSPVDRIVNANLKCVAADPPSVGIRPGGEVPRFRADTSGWEFHFGWMAGRLDGVNAKSGRELDVALETPFVRWPVRHPTQLPSGHVIFQLGWEQICILDPNERKIALLAKGRWPVVIVKPLGQ